MKEFTSLIPPSPRSRKDGIMGPLTLLLGITLLAFTGCGDTDPVSSTGEQTLSAPSAKLTISRSIAGGWRSDKMKLTATALAANAATNEGPSTGCPEGWTPRDMAGSGELDLFGPFTILDQSHCAAPNRLSFNRGEFTWLLDSGDELHGTYTGRVVIGAPIMAEGLWRITGGTGHLAGASGALTVRGPLTPGEGEGGNAIDGLFEGLIELPNSAPISATALAANAATSEGPSSGCPEGWTPRDMAGSGEFGKYGSFTILDQSHCAAPDRLSFNRGEFIWLLDSGDELHGTYDGRVVIGAPIMAQGVWRINGGTGHFANALGALRLKGPLTPGEGEGGNAIDAVFEGRIIR